MEIKNIINSKTLKKLEKSFKEAEILIKKHILGKNPIIIRHHADADGFSGGFILEKAITPLIQKVHTREREAYFSILRRPSTTPYYSYGDANKDLSYFLSDRGKYEYKKPLVIIIDNGSSKQDILALKKLKIYDVKTIVIDHHPPDKEVYNYIDVHINPHDVGSEYDFSAGMLCAELANLLNPKIENTEFVAAVSAYADKIRGEEKDEYLKFANKKGYTNEFIAKTAEVLDFEALSLGYIDSKNLLNDFFGKDKDKQKKIIKLLSDEVELKKASVLTSAKKYSHISRTSKTNIVIVPMDKINFRGEYPMFGKTVGLMHDYMSKKSDKPTISIGLSEGMITFRGTSDSSLDVNKIIKSAKMKFLHAQISGGGHKKAGSIRFVPAAFEEIKEFILQKVKE